MPLVALVPASRHTAHKLAWLTCRQLYGCAWFPEDSSMAPRLRFP